MNLLRCDLSEKFRNLLVFDASSSKVFFGGESGGKTVFRAENFEKSKMSRYLPEEFEKTVGNLDFAEPPRVIIGNGPGAFTGIKTGTAFFLAYIYSLGITKVETVSSFSFISALFDSAPEDLRLVLIPFNKGEYFAAVLDKENRILKGDVFLKPPYENIFKLAKSFGNRAFDAAAASECGGEFLSELEKIINIKELHFDAFKFDPEKFESLPGTKVVDIVNTPYIINHIIQPANLDKDGNFYVTDQLQEE